MKFFKSLYNGGLAVERYFAGISFMFLVFAGFIQVVFRYVFKLSVAWADELILFCLLWFVFVASSVATEDKKHIIISVLVDALPKKVGHWVTIFSQIVWVVMAGWIGYIAILNAKAAFVSGSLTLGGKFPYWIAMASIPVGLLLMMIKVAVLIVRTLKGEADQISAEEALMKEVEDLDL